MKKIAGLPALLFLSLVLFVLPGCEKDIPEILEKPNIKLEVSDPNPEFGGTSTVTWEVTGEYNTMSVRINGENISTSQKGEKIIQNIKNKQIISVICWTLENSEPIQDRIEINPKEEIIVIPNPPIITSISVSPETLPVGGGICTISLSASNVEQIFLSGAWGEFSSPYQFSTPFINQDTSFNFILKGEGGEISQSILVKVEIPLTDQELKEAMLTFGPWREVFSRESYNEEGGPWTTRNINYNAPCAIDDFWTFSLVPKRVTLSDPFPCGGANPYVHTWDWSLNGDILSGFGDRKIIYISWDQMIWKQLGYETDWATGEPITVPIWIETTFIHPN